MLGAQACAAASDGVNASESTIHDSTFAWLRAILPRLDRAKPTIVFTHFPLGEKVTNRPVNADALLECLLDYNLQAAFSGHWHALTEHPWRRAVLTTDRCCSRIRFNHDGSKEKGWFVCTAKDGKITRRFVEIPAELQIKTAAL